MTTLLVAISGGHLAQLRSLSTRLDLPSKHWVTDRTPQSQSLLADECVTFVPTRPPRDWAGVLADTRPILRAIRSHRVTRIVSTGAQVALSAYLAAKISGVSMAYIESATRVSDVSATGKVLERLPGVHRYRQYTEPARKGWSYRLSVFDSYESFTDDVLPTIRKAVVSLGGNGDYGFDRLLNRVDLVLPKDVEVLWQVDRTAFVPRRGTVVQHLPASELSRAMAEADVVIGHAGTGTALASLDAGKIPLLAPRSSDAREHVDDHQADLGKFLSSRRLAVVTDASTLSIADVMAAATLKVAKREELDHVDLF